MTTAASKGREITGKHVLIGLVSFFLFVAGVNAYMITKAVTTFSGLDGEDSYRRGLDYNRTIAEAEMQSKLGWSGQTAALPGWHGIGVTLLDRDGHPVTGLAVTGKLERPSTNTSDETLTFKETAPGRYEAQTAAQLAAGGWVVNVDAAPKAVNGEAPAHFRLKQRLTLK